MTTLGMTRNLLLSLIFFSLIANGQKKTDDKQSNVTGVLSNQNPSVVPDVFELGRRAGITEQDHDLLKEVHTKVEDIEGTISWMRGAWWALGGMLTILAVILGFFGTSILVAIEDRIHRARATRTNP